jgi:hypothetical protein
MLRQRRHFTPEQKVSIPHTLTTQLVLVKGISAQFHRPPEFVTLAHPTR